MTSPQITAAADPGRAQARRGDLMCHPEASQASRADGAVMIHMLSWLKWLTSDDKLVDMVET